MKKIHELMGKKNFCIYLLALIIILQLFYTTYCFAFLKKGCHSDEIWSYGLANSTDGAFNYIEDDIYLGSKYKKTYKNFDKWLTGSIANDYITVQKGERFDYTNVYHNQVYDYHPPLYYMLLHTVCSFFPDTFSFWFAFVLSAIFLVFTQIFLFKLSGLVFEKKNRFIPLLVCLLYACSTGALDTFIFMRMYSLLAMIVTMNLYFQVKLLKSDGFDLKHNILPIIITAFLAFMTHHFAIIFVGAVTAFVCIWLIFKRLFKKMFIYGLSILGTLGLSVAVFPATITHLTYKDKSPVYPFIMQIRYLENLITSHTFGFGVSLYSSPVFSYILGGVFSLVVLCIPLCFLFRKEPKLIKAKESVKNFFRHFGKSLVAVGRRLNYPLIMCIGVVAVYLLVPAYRSDFYNMGSASERYIMLLFPTVCVSFCGLVCYIVGVIPKVKKISAVVTAAAVLLCCVMVNVNFKSSFIIEQKSSYTQISEKLAGQRCVTILDSDWLMECFPQYVGKCSQIKFVRPTSLKTTKYDGPENNKPIYYFISQTNKLDGKKITAEDIKTNAGQHEFFPTKQGNTVIQKTNSNKNEKAFEMLKAIDGVTSVKIIDAVYINGLTYDLYEVN